MEERTREKVALSLVDEDLAAKQKAVAAATEEAERRLGGLQQAEEQHLHALYTQADSVQGLAIDFRNLVKNFANLLMEVRRLKREQSEGEIRLTAFLNQRRPGLGWGESGDVVGEMIKLVVHQDEENDQLRPANWPRVAGDRRLEVRVKDRQGHVSIGDTDAGEAMVQLVLDPEIDGAVLAVTKAEPTLEPREQVAAEEIKDMAAEVPGPTPELPELPTVDNAVEGPVPEQPLADPVVT